MASDLAVPEGLNRVNPSVMQNVSTVLGKFTEYLKSSSDGLNSILSELKEKNNIDEKRYKEDKKNNKELAEKIKNDVKDKNDTYNPDVEGEATKLDILKSYLKEGGAILKQMKDDVGQGLKDAKLEKNAMGSLLGPLNLLIAPFHDVFKHFGPLFKTIGGTIGKVFATIKGKLKPSESDVGKAGPLGIGALYIGGLLKKIFGKKGKDGEGGGLFSKIGDFFKGVGGKIGGFFKGFVEKHGGLKNVLIKGGGIASLAGGLIWGAVDGINGWIKSQDWGTSKIGGFLGGFLGGTGKGTKNAFKNAGKFALIGAGAGTLIAPPIGTIVGGLAGAAVGGLMGYFGGEEMAKQIDDIFNVSKFKKIWKDDKTSVTQKVGLTVLEGVSTVVKAPFKIMGKIGGGIVKGVEKLVDTVRPAVEQNCREMAQAWERGGIKEVFKTGINKIKESTKHFLEDTPVGQWINDSIVKPIKRFFTRIGDVVSYIANGGWSAFGDLILGRKEENGFLSNYDALLNARDFGLENGTKGLMKVFEKYYDDELKNERNEVVKKKYFELSKSFSKIVGSDEFKSQSSYEQIGVMTQWFKDVEEKFGKQYATDLQSALMDRAKMDKMIELLKEDVEANQQTAENSEEMSGLKQVSQSQTNYKSSFQVRDAILRPDGSVIETDPQDTLVALKNIPNSMNQVQSELAKTTRDSINGIGGGGNFSSEIRNKLNDIANILNQILSKDIQINLPQQTRYDLDLVMSGGIV